MRLCSSGSSRSQHVNIRCFCLLKSLAIQVFDAFMVSIYSMPCVSESSRNLTHMPCASCNHGSCECRMSSKLSSNCHRFLCSRTDSTPQASAVLGPLACAFSVEIVARHSLLNAVRRVDCLSERNGSNLSHARQKPAEFQNGACGEREETVL